MFSPKLSTCVAQSRSNGVVPCTTSCASTLLYCANERAISEGRTVHDHIVRMKYDEDVSLAKLLIHMYGKWWSLREAQAVFRKMPEHDADAWHSMITAYTHARQGIEALHFLECMQQEAVAPTNFTYITLLSACAKECLIVEGKRLHSCSFGSNLASDVLISNTIVNLYVKCGHLEDACLMFESMPERDVVSWNIMLAAYIQCKKGNVAIQLLQNMLEECLIPNKVTLSCITNACANQTSLFSGKRVHTYIIGSDFGDDVSVGNAVMHMYANCGSLHDAIGVFHGMPMRNVVSWTTLIAAYVQHRLHKEAVHLLEQMQVDGVLPNNVTFVSILSACASQADLTKGKQIHTQILSSGLDLDIEVGNGLINMYGKCGDLMKANMIYDDMPKHDTISCNSLLASFCQHGLGKDALRLFKEMCLNNTILDRATYVTILEACTKELALDEGKQVHAYIRGSAFELDPMVVAALINMYRKCGSFDNAREVFNKLTKKDVVLWTSMISAYCQYGYHDVGLQYFQQMKLEGIIPDEFAYSNVFSACLGQGGLAKGMCLHACIVGSEYDKKLGVCNALISMYSKCGSLDNAELMFDKILKKNVVTWTSMISVYIQHGLESQALLVFSKMQLDGVMPNHVTIVSLLDACANLAALEDGSKIYHLLVSSDITPDAFLVTALINMYNKCGSLQDAERIFECMAQETSASWNSMITAYSQHGHVTQALHLFWRMQLEGVTPDEVTFLSALSSCSHAGLLDEARDCFVSMHHFHGLIPTTDHCNCMIDLLGRAARLDEIEVILKELPSKATMPAWMSFLNACRMHLDVERGERAASYLLKLDPQNDAAHLLLYNIYAAAGRWNDAATMTHN